MIEKVESYVRENYKNLFKDRPLIITEFESHFTVSDNKDRSPLILSKEIVG